MRSRIIVMDTGNRKETSASNWAKGILLPVLAALMVAIWVASTYMYGDYMLKEFLVSSGIILALMFMRGVEYLRSNDHRVKIRIPNNNLQQQKRSQAI